MQNGWILDGRIQNGCNHQVESKWMSEVFLCKWWEPILASVSEFERKYYDGWIQDYQIQDGRIQDGCHHHVRWEWMSLSQIELVWVSIRVEWECFWVNLREDNKVSESKMAVSESNMAEFKKAAIIKLSENEWVKFFCAKWLNPTWQNSRRLPSSSWFRMNEWSFFLQYGWIHDGRILDGCISSSWVRMNEWRFFVQMLGTNLGKCEWLSEDILWWLIWRLPNSRKWNSRWLPSSSSVKMNEWSVFGANGGDQSWQVWVSLKENTKMAQSKMAKFNMAEFKIPAISKLNENIWVWVRLN